MRVHGPTPYGLHAPQVLERIKEPLKSVIGRDDPAVTYAVLANVLLLAQRAPVIFEADYTTFYCRTHDPWSVCTRAELPRAGAPVPTRRLCGSPQHTRGPQQPFVAPDSVHDRHLRDGGVAVLAWWWRPRTRRYIKKLKMEILSALASSSNVYEVVNELTEYARDVVHPNMAREAVRAVGRIALAVSAA